MGKPDMTGEERPPTIPSVCAFCQSGRIQTASKAVDSSTYWRCLACGEIWSAERLPQPPRYRFLNRL